MSKRLAVTASVVAALMAGAVASRIGGQSVGAQGAAPEVQIDQVSIGGVVLNANGDTPEAGVWVIAQTNGLPTPFRRIVVTDDQGRFVVPDLPNAPYELWVRGYGLSDSERVKAPRGTRVSLRVNNAKTPQDAAKIYPANYWFSLFEPPPKEELPAKFASREEWEAQFRRSCGGHCHDVGRLHTRLYSIPGQWDEHFNHHRGMRGEAEALGMPTLTKRLADWTSRTWAGEVPPAPPRPVGVERNIVLTQWNWGVAESFIHDLTSTDKRNPLLYPNGNVYGLDSSKEAIWALDPIKNTVTRHDIPPRSKAGYNPKLSYYFDGGGETGFAGFRDWTTNPHNPMMDDTGKVWITTQVRGESQQTYPKWVKQVIETGTGNPADLEKAAKLVQEAGHHRQLGYYDTKTKQFVLVDTSFSTHHLQFDKQGRIWMNANASGEPIALGMFDPSKFNADTPLTTEARAQKAMVRYNPKTGKTIEGIGYAVSVNAADGSIWQTSNAPDGPLNKLFKYDPKDGTFKDYPLPAPGRVPHGIDTSTDGRVWFSAGSGHLGRFDPKTEQFKYWELPGPKFKGTGSETGSAEFPYFLWVDQFDVLGLGKDTVIVCGTTSSALKAFDPRTETFTIIRIPYPLTFYARGMDGRIDDPKAGWKGRGVWATHSAYLPRMSAETKLGSVVHIQLRPNPLAY